MVIRLVAVPDFLDLADFDEIFHAVLGWDSGIGYAFQVHRVPTRLVQKYALRVGLPYPSAVKGLPVRTG